MVRLVEVPGCWRARPRLSISPSKTQTFLPWKAARLRTDRHGGILPFNPAIAVRGPKHVVKRGKTPVLAPEEARASVSVSKEVAPAVPISIFAAHSRVFLWAIHPEAG